MADVGDAPRVAGAGLEAGLAGHRGEDLVVAGDLLLELPEGDVVLLDPGRAAVAVDLGPLEQAGIGARGRLDHAEGAVLEPQAATAVSSTSIRSWARVAVWATIDSTSPISQ